LPWIVDGQEMEQVLNIKAVTLINDFVGIGYGLLALGPKDLVPLNDAKIIPGAPKACLGAGTGLGETFLTYNGSDYDVWPAEGGHADFSPRDEVEFKLLEYLKKVERISRVSVERVVSGLGYPRIYEFFTKIYPEEINAEVEEKIKSKTIPAARVIDTYAQNGKCTLSKKTVDKFVALYGAEAGNLALKTLPFGGLYVAGGLAPRLLWAIKEENKFYKNFIDKGRLQSQMEKIPVLVVTHPQVGLLGARVVCRRTLKKQGVNNITRQSKL